MGDRKTEEEARPNGTIALRMRGDGTGGAGVITAPPGHVGTVAGSILMGHEEKFDRLSQSINEAIEAGIEKHMAPVVDGMIRQYAQSYKSRSAERLKEIVKKETDHMLLLAARDIAVEVISGIEPQLREDIQRRVRETYETIVKGTVALATKSILDNLGLQIVGATKAAGDASESMAKDMGAYLAKDINECAAAMGAPKSVTGAPK